MNEVTERHEMASKTVVYRMPGTEAVTVRRDVEYRVTEAGASTMDVYYPAHADRESRIPAVVIVLGYRGAGFREVMGCDAKEMGAIESWGRLIAASGLAGITYNNVEPIEDINVVIRFIRENREQLGIDASRMGLWACSGNVPNALSVLMRGGGDYLKCAALCYGFMLDLDGSTGVAEAQNQWKFANPCEGRSVEDLPRNVALFIARAGRDEFLYLNESIDAFVAKALKHNLPVTFANHAAAPHAFDLMDDSEMSCEIIRQILSFLRFHLSA